MNKEERLSNRWVFVSLITLVLTGFSVFFDYFLVPGIPGDFTRLLLEIAALVSVVSLIFLLFKYKLWFKVSILIALTIWLFVQIRAIFLSGGYLY